MLKTSRHKYTLGVDPGLNGTGWALLYNESGETVLHSHGIFFHGITDSLVRRSMHYSEDLQNTLKQFMDKVNEVCIEYPAYFDTTSGNMIAKRGDLTKLTFLVGVLTKTVQSLKIKVTLVPVNTWKGQLPKEVVKRRILKKLGENQCRNLKSHDWDAVGLGLYGLGITI